MKFTVKRQHQGDKFYMPGDEREADPADVAHLLRSGVLSKAKPAPKNKAEAPLANKGQKAGA
ncbi:hypothetical protein [Labrys sp. 22185]|uniref:hypothetical protein n=1 Tax=Labrys sp. 22185 TaxID=3453888 RepID=UPI003F82F749